MNPLNAKMVEFIAAASAMGEKAQTVLQAKEASDKAVSERLQHAVDALAENGRIDLHEKTACADILKDHGKAIEFITKLAGHRLTEEAGRLGNPTGTEKVAAIGSLQSPFAGVRSTQLKDSDLALINGLGLDPALFGG